MGFFHGNLFGVLINVLNAGHGGFQLLGILIVKGKELGDL